MAEPAKPDLSNFGSLHEAICPECGYLKLVMGPPEGPEYCKECWFFPRWYKNMVKEREKERVSTTRVRRKVGRGY